jgi:peroxiredoxin Q/BCP
MRPLAALLLTCLALGACKKSAPPPAKKELGGEQAPSSTLLKVGDQSPPLRVKTHTGEELDLAKLGKPAVVYFYPKDDTTGCTIEAKEIRDVYTEVKGADALVIGVSADGEASHKAFAEKYGLPFFLVPDESHAIANAFGVPLKNGKASRVSFVLSADGRITKVFPKVTPTGHGAELLAALGEARASARQ